MSVTTCLKDGVLSFLNKYYSNQYACLISGSHVDNNSNEYSDIDVLIFTEDRNTVFNETLQYENFKIQAIVIPVQIVQDLLWVDYITSKGAFINMIAKGVVLFDNSNFLKYLISHTKELELLGGRPLSDHEVYMIRVKITSLLFDVMGGEDIHELLFSINSILDLISEFKLKMARNWCGDGKYRMRHIKAFDKKFHSELIKSVEEIYAHKNKTPFIDLMKKELNNHGGLLPYYSKANSLSIVSSNYLVIEINVDESEKELAKHTIKTLSDFADSIKSKKIGYYFFSSKAVGVNKIEQNIYMIIDAEKKFLNDFLIDHLNFFVCNKSGLSKLLFPFQFDPRYRFSNEDIYNSVAPIFYEISNLVIENPRRIFNQSFQLQFSLTLMKEIKINWFCNDSIIFNSFIDYLIECWLVFSYDDGTGFTTTHLFKNKKNVIQKFESMYSEQKEELKNIYNSNNVDQKLLQLLKKIPNITNINNIPLYKTYLLYNNDIEAKKWSLFREVIFKLLSIEFIDNRFISYIPFVVKKIELND